MAEKQDALILKCIKTDNDVVLHFFFWLFAVSFCFCAFFAKNILFLYYLAAPFALTSVIYAFFKASYKVTVTENYIEKRCFGLYCRRKQWEEICAYSLKHIEGHYYIDTKTYIHDDSGYVEGEYTIRLHFQKGIPMRISNSLTNYKKFKKTLKARGIKRTKTKKKKAHRE